MTFQLQILHASDLEGGIDAIDNAPNFATIAEALEADAANAGYASIILSAGDNYLSGPFFNAASDSAVRQALQDAYQALYGEPGLDNIREGSGRIDIAIMNIIGFDASAIGNHEFDLGSDVFETIIEEDVRGTLLSDIRHLGAQFPYLSANLDFSGDADLGDLFTSDILANTDFMLSPTDALAGSNPYKIAQATTIEAGGEMIGVVGATTQLLETISSPEGTTETTGGANDMAALAAVLQPIIDDLIDGADNTLGTADDVNKVVLVSHLQDINLEKALAPLLHGVDVIIAGGSDTLLADSTDTLRAGDVAAEDYPFETTNADGDPLLIVSTDGEYSYVGRLVVEFDEDGKLIPFDGGTELVDETISGAYATDDAGVLAVTGEATIEDAIAASANGSLVEALVDSVVDVVTTADGTIAGETEVFIEGRREFVRTEETNMGNLTADANIFATRAVDPTVTVSIKNGGGIRAPIGEVDGLTGDLLPTAENPTASKDAGDVSQLDIENSLRFNNTLTLVTLTAAQLVEVLEHAVSASGPGSTPGQFAQVGGVAFSFDVNEPAGSRVQSVALLDDAGERTQVIVDNGEVLSDAPAAIRVVTLNFMADGGDGYPYPDFEAADAAFYDRVDNGIGEQDAFFDYMAATYPDDDIAGNGFNDAETPVEEDERIQQLDSRYDSVDTPIATDELGEIGVAAVFDSLAGEGGSEVVVHEGGRLYTTNGATGTIDVWDIATETQVDSIDLTYLPGFDGVQSVAVKNGLIAAAVSTPDTTRTVFGETVSEASNGYIVLIDAATGQVIDRVTVGVLPDMVTFTPDGTKLLVANEGEFSGESDLDRDPMGTVSIVDVSNGALDPDGQQATFIDFDGLEHLAREKGIRLPEYASMLRGLEPEYIAVSPDGSVAYVTLQENNAVAVLDLATGSFTDIVPLGTVDHSQAGFEIDANDDGVIDIRTYDNLVGLRMPDAIAAAEIGGETYILTANEGDGRGNPNDGIDNPHRGDEARVEDILAGEIAGVSIDASVDTTGLERLTVSLIDGDTDGDGDIDVLHAFGSRSFTIFDVEGNVVFDSGAQFEKIIADLYPERFNNDDGEEIAAEDDNRSDAKGPEPEAIAVGEIDGETYAFIGLERDSGIMIYNISAPVDAYFVDYIPGFRNDLGDGTEDFVGPETIAFIPASESTSGVAQIAVAYEITGHTVVYDLGELEVVEPAATLISEFQPNPDGTDPATVTVELSGEAGESFDLWLVAVENDGAHGIVDRAANVTGTFDANGLATVEVDDLENPSFTYILTDDFTGTASVTDIDTDDDGVVDDLSAFGTILDALGVSDSAADDATLYGEDALLGGSNLLNAGNEPRLAFRDGSRGDWYQVEGNTSNLFDAAGNAVDTAEFDTDPTAGTDSFGAINPERVGLQPDLQITEIWMGQDGTDVTADWFEITNTGPVAWSNAAFGDLFYDDDSMDPSVADMIQNIVQIDAGESVIVVVGDATDAAAWEAVWADDVDLTGVQVGWADGAGLGQGGDGVTLLLRDEPVIGQDPNDGLNAGDIVDFEAYPDTAGFSGSSWEVDAGQFANLTDFTDTVATTEQGGVNGDEAAISSPGYIPTPGSSQTAIYTIQGSGAASALDGQTVTTTGIVTAVFQGPGEIGGYFIQDATGDGDDTTSDGIFVFDSTNIVTVGDEVTLTADVLEFNDKTELTNVAAFSINSSGNALPAATQIDVTDMASVDLEALEGMLVEVIDGNDGTIAVTENYGLGRFGQIEVAPEVNVQATQVLDPQTVSAQAIQDHIDANFANRILIDDGRTDQNPDVKVLVDDGNGGAYDSTDNPGPTLRIGTEFESITGVLDYNFGDYAVQYDAFDNAGNYTPLPDVPGTGLQPEDDPDVGGALEVASFNVLNFFTTLDDGSLSPIGLDPRGANDQAEYDRQLEKLVEALVELDADVVGLQELENNGFGAGSAIATLVDALNAELGAPVYAFVDYTAESGNVDGFLGTDAITTGMIYKVDELSLVGQDVLVYDEFSAGASADDTFALAEVLNQVASSDDQVGDFQRNRPTVAASFEDANGERITIAVNHYKSKGDSNLEDLVLDAQAHVNGGGTTITQADIDALLADENYDQGDGQGFWNGVREEAAAELAAWLAGDPTGSGDPDYLIIGDLNAYGQEAPVDALNAAGLAHLLGGDADDYSYTFFGEQGALDHVFASDSLAGQVTGAAEWHINADEPVFLDYNTDFEDPNFFDPASEYRASDHDPAVVGITLNSLVASPGFNLVAGSTQDETLSGTAASDELHGRAGNDVLLGSGDADLMNGGDGIDTADYSASASAIDIGLMRTGNGGDSSGDQLVGIERIVGSGFDDLLVGAGSVSATLEGGAGNDTIYDYAGDSFLYGGAGNDVIVAGAGNDLLNGGLGNDVMQSGTGADVFEFDTTTWDRDTILDWQDGVDLIDVTGAGLTFGDFTEVDFQLSDGTDVVRLEYFNGTALQTISIVGFTSADIDQNDFV